MRLPAASQRENVCSRILACVTRAKMKRYDLSHPQKQSRPFESPTTRLPRSVPDSYGADPSSMALTSATYCASSSRPQPDGRSTTLNQRVDEERASRQ